MSTYHKLGTDNASQKGSREKEAGLVLTLAWRSGGQGRQAALGTGGHQPPRVGGPGVGGVGKGLRVLV